MQKTHVLILLFLSVLIFPTVIHISKERKAELQLEVGEKFIVPVRFVGGTTDTSTFIEVHTPAGQSGVIQVPVYVNHLRNYLYEIKVDSINKISFIRVRSRYIP